MWALHSPQLFFHRWKAGGLAVKSNSPLAAGLGGRAGITLGHGSSSSGEGSPERTESSRLGEGCAEHVGRLG